MRTGRRHLAPLRDQLLEIFELVLFPNVLLERAQLRRCQPGKRRQEAVSELHEGTSTRPVLEHYSLPFLDQMVSLVTTGTVISYAIYTVNSPLIGNQMMLTIPPVVYGIFRYLYLIYDRSDDRSMAQIVAGDRGIQAAGDAYALFAFLLLYVFN